MLETVFKTLGEPLPETPPPQQRLGRNDGPGGERKYHQDDHESEGRSCRF